MSYLKSLIELEKKPNFTTESVNWIVNKTKTLDDKFQLVDISNIQVGSFYFMYYDLYKKNKSTKMEQIVPLFVVDYKDAIDSRVLYILNMNFMPIRLKTAFFSKFYDYNKSIFESNININNVNDERTIPSDYKYMWNFLIQYAFEYSIREIRLDLINRIYKVSSDYLHYMTSLNTQMLTGVDEAKLNEIWITKLKKETYEDRVNEILTIKNNYYKIIEELQEKFKNLKSGIG